MSCADTPAVTGEVLVYRGTANDRAAHDLATCGEIARKLAALKGFRFAGDYDGGKPPPSRRYWVSISTLIGF